MKIKFTERENRIINSILTVFRDSRSVPYLVGGYVRNKLIGITPKDFDIASSMLPHEIVERGKALGFEYCDIVNEKLGTVLLIIDGEKIEHTTFRKESYPAGGSHEPSKVTIGVSMQEDAMRRDFSVNALYADLRTGEVLDPTGRGLEDIRLKRLRSATEDPEVMIKDDALRLLRLVRFACQLEFDIDSELANKARIYSSQLTSVSKERIAKEMDGILLADADDNEKRTHNNGSRAVVLLENLGLMRILIPEFEDYRHIGYGTYHKYSVYIHTAHVVGNVPADKVLKYAALLHDVAKPMIWRTTGTMHGHDIAGEEIAYSRMLAMGHAKKLSREVAILVREHMYDLRGDAKENKIRKKIQTLGYETFERLIELRRADFLGSGREKEPVRTADKFTRVMDQMKDQKVPMQLPELNIRGSDIIKAYNIRGRMIGEALDRLLSYCCMHPLKNTKENLLREAGNILRNLN